MCRNAAGYLERLLFIMLDCLVCCPASSLSDVPPSVRWGHPRMESGRSHCFGVFLWDQSILFKYWLSCSTAERLGTGYLLVVVVWVFG